MAVIGGDDVPFAELPGRRSADPLRDVPAASSVRIVELAPGRRRFAHRHPASEEVVFVRKGSGVVYIDGERTPVRAGDTIHVPVGAAHATIPNDDEVMELVCFFPHPQLADNMEETTIDVTTDAKMTDHDTPRDHR